MAGEPRVTFGGNERRRIHDAVQAVEGSTLPGLDVPSPSARYPEQRHLIGKAESAIAKGDSGTINIYRGNPNADMPVGKGDTSM